MLADCWQTAGLQPMHSILDPSSSLLGSGVDGWPHGLRSGDAAGEARDAGRVVLLELLHRRDRVRADA
jgi:hypothetical protein